MNRPIFGPVLAERLLGCPTGVSEQDEPAENPEQVDVKDCPSSEANCRREGKTPGCPKQPSRLRE